MKFFHILNKSKYKFLVNAHFDNERNLILPSLTAYSRLQLILLILSDIYIYIFVIMVRGYSGDAIMLGFHQIKVSTKSIKLTPQLFNA